MPYRRIAEHKRRLRKAKMGKERKRKLRKYGSTPPFPIHPQEDKKKKSK